MKEDEDGIYERNDRRKKRGKERRRENNKSKIRGRERKKR